MSCKVFVSCGQGREEERAVAEQIGCILRDRGFEPYIAKDVQTIFDLNSGIVGELKSSDCFLFVNFRRDELAQANEKERTGPGFRGSLFSNQELAIAYALGFDRILIVNQADVRREGMLQFMVANTETFVDYADCPSVVARELDRSGWDCRFSRNLQTGTLSRAQLVTYGRLEGNFWHLDIHNLRPDIAALECTAKLSHLAKDMENWQPSPNQSPLKATGRQGFAHTIFPNSHEAFDLFCNGALTDNPYEVMTTSTGFFTPPVSGSMAGTEWRGERHVYLNNALDVQEPQPLPITPGAWRLRYAIYAIAFPLLTVDVYLTVDQTGEVHARLKTAPNT